MTRNRLVIVAVVLVAFFAIAGYAIYSNQHRGGQNVSVTVTVTGAKSMSPSQLTAHQDDNVTIYVSSDTNGEVHLHGYDVHFSCTAGQVTSHTFKADKTGSFDIEWETTGAPLGTFMVIP